MEAELNVTYLTLGGHVEVVKYRYLYFVIMFAVYLLILCSNSTIICLIWIHRNLHEPMYIFIAALLLNSVLFSTTIYPKLLMDFLSERQIISYSACLVQYFLYYSLGGSDFLLLAAMAYDRYVSICRPLQYPTIMSRTTVSALLALAWLLPACQVAAAVVVISKLEICSSTLGSVFCRNSVHRLHCVSFRVLSVYSLVVLVNVALLPVCFILFTYTKIFIITYHSCGAVRKKAAETCLPHLLVLLSFSSLCAFDVIIGQLESDLPKTVRLIMTLQVILYHPLLIQLYMDYK
ncbi:LOW QUALITY PROTEIN: olfactory receptor 13C2-like [Aulostomus maculatus]